MAHLQLSAVAGGRPAAAGGRGDEMEDVALLDSYDVEMGVPPPGGAEEEAAAEAHVRVTGMTCSACTSAVEAAVSARRGVRRVAVSLLQNRAHVVFDPALAKVTMLLCSLSFSLLPPRWCGVAMRSLRARACGSRGGWELADGRRVVIFF
jgi:Cu+-exporting ATPase